MRDVRRIFTNFCISFAGSSLWTQYVVHKTKTLLTLSIIMTVLAFGYIVVTAIDEVNRDHE